MPVIRPVRNRARISILSMTCVVFFIGAYIWVYKAQEYDDDIANERCMSELSSVRYQLDIVSDYKKKMDWLLTETQKEYKIEKSQAKEMMDNYIMLKHHLYLCESQTEDLEKECRDRKEELQTVKQELEKCKKPPG